MNGGRWTIAAEFTEVESGKDDSNRPQLEAAFKACRAYRATLVIAKIDRLSRDAHFLLGLQKAGVRFVAADMPEANEMVVGIMAVVAREFQSGVWGRVQRAHSYSISMISNGWISLRLCQFSSQSIFG